VIKGVCLVIWCYIKKNSGVLGAIGKSLKKNKFYYFLNLNQSVVSVQLSSPNRKKTSFPNSCLQLVRGPESPAPQTHAIG